MWFALEVRVKTEESTVGDLHIGNSDTTNLNERLDHVLEKMAELRFDSTLVTRNGRLAGIVTMTDACNTFIRFLNKQFWSTGGDAAA